jgi:LacI family transcriptional regulator
LRHVAELAGVSVATVSRVVSGSNHPVSERTRDRVLAAADHLSFEPNQLARALVTARSQTIGVVVHDIADPYFAEIVRGLEDGLHADDYRLLVASSDRDPDREVKYLRAFHAHQVDAVVFAASSLIAPEYQTEIRAVVDRYRRGGGAVVTLSDHILPCPRVVFDNRRAIADMIHYLARWGHRRVAYLAGPGELAVTGARLEGYKTALSELGIQFEPALVEHGPFTIQGGIAATADLLDRGEFTAILAANDLMAMGATWGLINAGLRVPDDVSVAGLDDIPIAEFGRVPLTTLRIPTYDMGRKGAALVLSILAGNAPADESLHGQIVERDSVAQGPFHRTNR